MVGQIETLMTAYTLILCIALESVIARSFALAYLPIEGRLVRTKKPLKPI